MSEDSQKRAAQSIRDRLLGIAKESGEAFDLMLTRYALERFLFRLSRSEHRLELVLKGAMLFQIWSGRPHRATRDLDLLARGETGLEAIAQKIRDICAVEVDEDGLSFHPSALTVREIRQESRYGGIRAKFVAKLGSASILVQIDFGVGDAVTPNPVETAYPTIFGTEPLLILTYPRETVVAEKLEAIVNLGMDNSRMKDYFDLWFIATTFQDDPEVLREAIRKTFERRQQPFPRETPVGLTDEFAANPSKQTQWLAFRGRAIDGKLSLQEVVSTVRSFANPLFFLIE